MTGALAYNLYQIDTPLKSLNLQIANTFLIPPENALNEISIVRTLYVIIVSGGATLGPKGSRPLQLKI